MTQNLSSGWSFSFTDQDGFSSPGWSCISIGFLHQGDLASGLVSFTGVIMHQGGFSSPLWSCIRLGFHQCDLASGWVFTSVVLHQAGFSPRWPCIRMGFHQGGLASGWVFTQVVTHWSALSEWVFIGVVYYQGGFHLDGFLSGWSLNLISLIREGFLHHLLSSLIRVAFHQGVVVGHTHNQLPLLLV